MLSERHPEIASYYLPRVTQTAVPNAQRLLEGFRAAQRRVVFTRHGPLLADGSDMIARRRRRDVEALASTGAPALWHRGTFEHESSPRWRPRPASWWSTRTRRARSTPPGSTAAQYGRRDARARRHGDGHVRPDDRARRGRPRFQRDRRRRRHGDVLRASPPRRAERLCAGVRSGLGHGAGTRRPSDRAAEPPSGRPPTASVRRPGRRRGR